MPENTDHDKSGERIAKVIARAGLASRREAEAWIAAGRVAVNGAVISSPALNVTPRDRIVVDGQPLPGRARTRLFRYHKPRGLVTTHSDPQGRPTIFRALPKRLPRVISIGRLDINSEGLLLLTNDGGLARALELPATGWLRRYRVRAHGSIMQDSLDALRQGITISGIHYGPIDATVDRVQGSNLWLTFAIREGKNREVRTILSHLGLEVTRLIRVSFGPFQLGELEEGAVEEVRTRVLREQLGEKLADMAGLDFSAPITARPEADAAVHTDRAPREAVSVTSWSKKASDQRPKQKRRSKGAEHTWRAPDEARPTKKLRRRFHGARDDELRIQPQGRKRSEALTDRKGRHVAVERYGEPPVRETERPETARRARSGERSDRNSERAGNRPPKSSSRRRSPDRARGPRPHRPKGRD